MQEHSELTDKLTIFLEKVCKGIDVPELTDEIIDQFGEDCKKILSGLRPSLYNNRDKFSVRLSNIGNNPRYLWLEQQYGRQPVTPSTMVKFKYGDLIEALFIALIKASGTTIDSLQESVTLDINGQKIKGTYDIKLNGEVWDLKSASSFSYTNKFKSCDSLLEDDPFGYIGQAIGYSQADGSPFGGWFVINKETGEYKTVPSYQLNNKVIISEQLGKLSRTLDVLSGQCEPPACPGAVDDTFNRKPTGKRTLSSKCIYCPHKDKCHPTLTYEPVIESKAFIQPWKYYVSNEA